MKIATFSNWGRKFLGMINDYWDAQGHEVKYEMGYSPELHEWSDLCFVDVCDHNAHVASQHRFPNTRLVIRCIDIECWVQQPGGVKWENVDAVIFGAEHMKELVESYLTFPEHVTVAHVPFGVDLSQWTFQQRDGTGKNVAWVAHQWCAKGPQLLLQVMAKLPGFKLHMLGTKSRGDSWLHPYIDQMIEELGLDVNYVESVPDVNTWLEDKDFLITSGMKEAFSYAAAEAAAKGIKPLIHNFYGARKIWPIGWIWNTVDECTQKIEHGLYNSLGYREYIEKHYSLEKMMQGIEEVCFK